MTAHALLAERVAAQVDLTQQWNPTYNAILSLVEDAVAHAEALEDRAPRSDQADLGLSVTVKDVIDTAGHVTTMGSPLYAGHLPSQDAEVVARIRRRGGVIISKSNLSEFAMGATSQNQHFGPVRNAWDPSRVAGGSSGGSAVAVAAGFADAALGTDTGGSVLVPSALNGIVGLRPSIGRIPNRGVYPVSVHFDTVGPMARTVGDVRRLFDAIEGRDPRDQYQRVPTALAPGRGIAGLRIGVPGGHFVGDEAIMQGVADALDRLAELGAEIVSLPLDGAERAQSHMARMMFADFLLAHEEMFNENPQSFGDDLQFRLRLGVDTTGLDYARGRRDAQAWRVELDAAFRKVDVIATPTVSRTAPLLAESTTVATSPVLTRFTHPWCLWDGPTLTVPIGHDEAGLPFSLSLTGAPSAEETLFATAQAYQDVTSWHDRRPLLRELESAGVTQ